MATFQDVDNWFTYHSVLPGQEDRYKAIRAGGRMLASRIVEMTPDGPEQRKSLEALREAVMWANAGIACNET